MSAETQTPTEPAAVAPRRLAIDLRQYGILAALVAIIVLFEVLTGGRLLMPGNVNNLIQQNSYVLILAIGMVMVIIAGHIDLSVGSVVAMVGAVAALAMSEWHLPWWLAVLVALFAGALVGAWQGFWVAYVQIPAFIVTLAGMLLFRGLTLVFLHGGTIGGLPNEFVAIGAGWLPNWLGTVGRTDVLTMVLGLAACVLLVVFQVSARNARKKLALPVEGLIQLWGKAIVASAAILAVCWQLANYSGTPIILIILAALILSYNFILNRSVFGRHVYAIGGNFFAAVMSGVKTKRVNFALFVNIGMLAALAGVVSTSRAGSAVASAGQNYELDAIAAVFIGGAAVQGGVGTVTGAMIGGLVMGVLNMGLSILSVDAAWQMAIKGLVLLLAVAFDLVNKRRGGR
ncbi:multiple monosaccharide ABC transporter permease [Propionicimonas sp.]|uniref:multiple monosaccharide ABC transporter permease n=1 Tax=Propionicimonas sp. TaxID=1955623 RepID=UPI0017C528A0|nr:multiple monosaccharide ABC transporter permease [Propionicimonas sp.]MBU3977081.1 sugar ABC transporter permease [Actinomycetota bacterium]MBA3020650.1 sugar ABC transporter permease [Propionicimonas sp.]MBU3985021.1 sugar ABC transporter permease [Actinomycetota bacterium]MBU4007022.1 sugar ABC transporter permease [Actinomycetota bacterium]MBU4064775.1 sugar ABC transporter permease [Actinomycetota bacterium]